eukprot:11627910-Alexandrium_andersonii.AAC.1
MSWGFQHSDFPLGLVAHLPAPSLPDDALDMCPPKADWVSPPPKDPKQHPKCVGAILWVSIGDKWVHTGALVQETGEVGSQSGATCSH